MHDDKAISIYVCSVTGSPLRREGDELVGEVGGLRYPIVGNIAKLLPDEAILPEGFDSLDAFRERYGAHTPGK